MSLSLVAGAACSCKRGGRQGGDGEDRTTSEAPPATTPASDDLNRGSGGGDWTEGRLPTSVNEGEPRQGGEVVVWIQTEPPSLNPIVHSDFIASRTMTHHVLESLVGIDPYDHPDYKIVPELAERWEISD